jgi:glycosyltransferase involved in cell wall biosynthesis
MDILAIVAARNEVLHISRCIRQLVEQGVEVILIDHSSSDGTREAAEYFLGNGLHQILDMAWEGYFSLEQQLLAKKRVVDSSRHDWIAHFDVDEWPSPPPPIRTLREMADIAAVHRFDAINFNEFVFLPLPGENHEYPGYETRMRDYYFFEPSYPRLQRMWRREASLSNTKFGGHRVTGRFVRQFPMDGNLRHYIALSEEDAIRKYSARRFAVSEIKRGWHANRLEVTAEKIRGYFRSNSRDDIPMKTLPSPMSREFDRTTPQKLHFWDWGIK